MVTLEELATRASRYCLNLDGLVYKDNVSYILGGLSMVSSGTLQLTEEGTIGNTASRGLVRDGKTIKVSLLFNHNFSIYLIRGVGQGGYKDSSLYRGCENHQGAYN